MTYTQLFRSLRESKGLTHDGLARLVGCHRNTVINVESGRPVKFKTIAELMQKMGFESDSAEMKSIALLWLEAISGINFTSDRSTAEARKRIARFRANERESAQALADAAVNQNLTVDQIQLLLFAAGNPQTLAIVEQIRELVAPASAAVPPQESLSASDEL